MRIVVITNLYPAYIDQPASENTMVVHFFSREWVRQGHEVEVFVIWPYYPAFFSFLPAGRRRRKYSSEASFTLDGVQITRIPFEKFPRLLCSERAFSGASETILEHMKSKPDVVICHRMDPSAPIATEVGERLGVKCLLVLHKSDLQNLDNGRYYKKNAFVRSIENAAGVAFRSEYLHRWFDGLFPELSKPKAVLKSGLQTDIVETSEFFVEKARRPIRRLLIVCRLIKDKNVDSVIRATRRIPDINLEIVGDGPHMGALKRLSEKIGVEDRVSFTGRLNHSETLSRMRAADIFAMPSTRETFGMVYLEAMSKGCITIGSRNQGIDGTIVDGHNGFLVDAGDTEDLVRKVSMIGDLSVYERERILLNALETLRGMTEERAASFYMSFIEDVLRRDESSEL
ncbi:MAG TPA: glycosyltransferase family 4 protein [Mesotoga infera]|uniref:Glycosyltransferase family 4 protein n=1 Tax=Mesotoga infera TaxID=1236046 RepID=A0A7C1H3E9_9BACT|nr:glycosyltransferase family 4 protein [Mesotoga infera]